MWVTETPWPPIIILAALLVICLLAWMERRQARYGIASTVLLLAAILVWVIERQVVTDREQIEAAIVDMVEAFHDNDLPRLQGHISPRAQGLQAAARFGVRLYDIRDDFRITDVNAETFADGSRARSHFRVNATPSVKGMGEVRRQPTRWEAKWQLEGDRWRMIELQQLDPLTGEDLSFPPLENFLPYRSAD